jgi:GPH family glycoside/pentoside/hexuronide:cation symporter
MNQPLPPQAPALRPLNLKTKLAYGAGDLGPGMTANLMAFSFLFFLANVAGLNPAIASLVLLVGRVWDGINDPIIGVLSDRTRSRWGRRHSWMIWGSIPFGLGFILIWLVPDWPLGLKFIYYAVAGIIFYTAYTAVNLPYAALTAELTKDYDGRTELTTFRLAFSLFGAVSALALGLVLSFVIADTQQQHAVLGVICAVISVLALHWCIWGTMPRARALGLLDAPVTESGTARTEMPLRQQLAIAFRNRPFLFVVGIYMFSWLGLQITAAIIPFYAVNWMQLDSYFPAALAVQGSAIVMIFLCNALSKRVGKRGLYFMGVGSWILVQGGLFFLQPNQVGLMYALCVIASFGVATTYLVPWSMLPDVIELDELQTGQRREGIFYAFMTLLQKMGLAVGIFLVGIALSTAGFVEAVPGQPLPPQPDSALFAIRIAIGPLPTVCLILGMILTYFYPITREVHAEILLKLQAKREQG